MTQEKENKSSASEKKRKEELLKVAKERFNVAAEAEADNRKEELDDQKFMVGEQWPQDIKNQRETDNRPCLTINRIPQFVRQITNDQRQNRPSIKINPVDDKADIETAKILQGTVRHIEYNSHADIAYDTAFEYAAKSGIGYWRIITQYVDALSFQQEILIKRIKDRFSVYMDPYYQEPDGSDTNWGFVFDKMAKDEYMEEFPDSDLASMSDWESLGDVSSQWVEKDAVRVAEYYYKVFDRKKIVLAVDQDGEEHVLFKDQITEEVLKTLHIVSERTTLIPQIKWAKINGMDVLEERDIPGEWIPIIPVIGDEQMIEGKRILSGIIRHAKDPQRMYNYWASAETETIALAPRAPFIGYAGSFEGYEDKWETANTKNHAYLEANPKMVNGQPAPLPQRNVVEPPVQAITQARAQSSEDLKATTGIYDATLGNRSNEQSGVAIQRRNLQAQTSNFHFIDNLSRSLRHTGRILLQWIPKVYDTPQMLRVIGDDGEVDMVQVNQVFTQNGKEQSHFLDLGRYDCTVDTGPSYATKRQEAVASMLDLLRSAPQLMNVSGDLLVRNMDWPGAQEIADRIKKTLPPNIVDDGKDKQQPLPPQVQQQMAQMSQMIKAMTQELHQNAQVIETKSLELASKERIAALEAETQLKIELLKHDAKDGQIAFLEEMREIQHLRSQNPIQNGAGGNPAAPPLDSPEQMPTGGSSPGQPMEGNP